MEVQFPLSKMLGLWSCPFSRVFSRIKELLIKEAFHKESYPRPNTKQSYIYFQILLPNVCASWKPSFQYNTMELNIILTLEIFRICSTFFWCHNYHPRVKSTDNVTRDIQRVFPGFTTTRQIHTTSQLIFPFFQAGTLPFCLIALSYLSMVAILFMKSVLNIVSRLWCLYSGLHVFQVGSLVTGPST